MTFDPKTFDVDDQEALDLLTDEEWDTRIEYESPDYDDGPEWWNDIDSEISLLDGAISALDDVESRLHDEALDSGKADEACLSCAMVFLAHRSFQKCQGNLENCPYARRESERAGLVRKYSLSDSKGDQ